MPDNDTSKRGVALMDEDKLASETGRKDGQS